MYDFDEVFGADGPLARAIPGFATRLEQIAMANTVAASLAAGGQLIVEAGTGTGKTFAYLVPILLSGRRVVVSTGTRTLQDQLFHRDLPSVARAIGRPVKVALLKGRANYLCLHRLDLAEQQAYARGLKREIAMALPVVREWARITRRGEIAELAQVSETDPVWPWVTSTRENCLGPDCPAFERCHVVEARREAQAADVVVVNHHLLLADLVLKEEGFGDLLPGVDAIVVDEAHQLPEIASTFLGFTISARQLQALSRDIASELIASAAATDVVGSFAQTLDRHVADLRDLFSDERARYEAKDWPPLVMESLERLQLELDRLVGALADSAKVNAGLAAIRRRTSELSLRIAMLLKDEAEVEPSGVRWTQIGTHGMSFHYVPVDVATRLGALIDASAGTWICTSATLAVGGDFTHFAGRIGMRSAATSLFGSPFDYERQALLYLPPGLDAPASSRYTRQVVEAALPVLEASGGRAFLLFTSHRALREAAVRLRERLAGASFPVLVQGEAPREVLLTRFREEGNAVLLGTSSFWEGVDVKGPALSVVVIDKLPFAVPDDPVLKARLAAIERRGGNPFFDEQVPQAVIELKQGVGRLIRDPEDFGVIMLCDPRLRTRGYGRIFLDSLPPMRRTDQLEEVTRFLRDKLSQAGILLEQTRIPKDRHAL
jgi:ATP-dependent DNA helicase DinG